MVLQTVRAESDAVGTRVTFDPARSRSYPGPGKLQMTKSEIQAWARQLAEALNGIPDIGSVEAKHEAVEVLVWTESAGRSARKAAATLLIPETALKVEKLIAFLNPYPGDDVRNADAAAQLLAERVIEDRGGAVLLTSMPPIVGAAPRVLVLGSMPGSRSLEMGEYYAHPQNRFWAIVEDVVGAPRSGRYEERVDALEAAHIALWDVLKHCSRVGSLDSNIDPRTEVPNELVAFLAEHASIRKVLFNGKKAARAFERLVQSSIPEAIRMRVQTRTMPSTSPANAAISYPDLLATWRAELV